MTFRGPTLIGFVLALATQFAAMTAPAQAQAGLIYISSAGNDLNNCFTPATACKTISMAHQKVLENGKIECVDPGYYFSATITKSVTIDCLAGGGAGNVQALDINAPGKRVRLRNLALNAAGEANALVNIFAAASVHFENVLVTGSLNLGIYDHRTGPGYLLITNTTIEANPGPGIVVAPAGGNIGVVLDNVRSTTNSYGLGVGAGGRVTIKRSVFSANSVAGIQADTGAIIDINESLISHNSTGIAALNGSTVALSNSNLDSNNTAINGAWATFGNNRLFANLNNGTAPTAVGTATSDLGQR